MTDAPPLASFHLPTARAVARAWRAAYIANRHGIPYSKACAAAEAAYRAMHPEAPDLDVIKTTSAILQAVGREHGAWLYRDLPPRPGDSRRHHLDYAQRHPEAVPGFKAE
jgi:hypothetical protein